MFRRLEGVLQCCLVVISACHRGDDHHASLQHEDSTQIEQMSASTLQGALAVVRYRAWRGDVPWSGLVPHSSLRCEEKLLQRRLAHRDEELTWEALLVQIPSYVDPLCSYDACEAVDVHSIVRAPMNAWSSVAFGVVGIYMGFSTLTDAFVAHRSGYGYWPLFLVGLTSAFTSLYLCVCSFVYHASLSQNANWYDIRGMYAVVACMIAGNVLASIVSSSLGVASSPRCRVLLDAGLFISLAVLYIMWMQRGSSAELHTGLQYDSFFAMLAVMTLLTGLTVSSAAPKLIGGAALFGAAALAMGCADHAKLMCWPRSWLQGIAGLHVFGAIAILLAFSAQRQACSDCLKTSLEVSTLLRKSSTIGKAGLANSDKARCEEC